MLGAKVVRGAYVEKERTRSQDLGYADPINAEKNRTEQMDK